MIIFWTNAFLPCDSYLNKLSNANITTEQWRHYCFFHAQKFLDNTLGTYKFKYGYDKTNVLWKQIENIYPNKFDSDKGQQTRSFKIIGAQHLFLLLWSFYLFGVRVCVCVWVASSLIFHSNDLMNHCQIRYLFMVYM